MKNLVMGVAKGYGWDMLEPFVTSFEKNCPSAELVLFVDDISEFTRDRLQCAERVRVVDVPAQYKDVLIIHTRWKMCADFLEQCGANYEQAFITDVRDVIFQGDIFEPFKNFQSWLGYATEADDIGGSKTGDKVDYEWLVSCFGKDEADSLLDKKIICCGTVIGTINEMKSFCHIMWEALKGETTWGHEQAVMNYLVHKNLLPIENLLELDVDSAIFTAALTDNYFIRGDKIFYGERVPSVVHQYDRHNNLIKLVDEIYHDKNFQADLRFSDMRSVTEQAICLLLANKIGDAAKFFMKKFLVTEDFSGCARALIRLWEIAMRNPLSPASELLELSAQSALKSVENFSNSDWNEICISLNRAAEYRHPVDPEFKNDVTTRLLKITEENFLAGERKQYLSCLELIISMEGGEISWRRN